MIRIIKQGVTKKVLYRGTCIGCDSIIESDGDSAELIKAMWGEMLLQCPTCESLIRMEKYFSEPVGK